MNDNVFCTLFNNSYLDKGLVLIDSLEQYAKDYKLYIFAMDQKTFDQWVSYHLSTCERMDLIGASNHTLDILKK